MIVAAVGLGVLVALAVLPAWLSGPLSWLLVGYVLWRAYPAVRSDLRRVRGARPLVRRRVRRGAFL